MKQPEPVPVSDRLALSKGDARRSSLPNTAGVHQPGPVPTFDAKPITRSEGGRSSLSNNIGDNQSVRVPTLHAMPITSIQGSPSSLPNVTGASQPGPAPASNAKTTTSGKARVKRPVGDKSGQRVKKKRQREHGQPTAHDSLGRPLFTRRSDGKLVYLRCLVKDCGRTDFNTVRALMRHVSDPRYAHKMDGIFQGNHHAVELCGVVASGENDLRPSSSTKVASSIVGHQNGGTSPRLRSGSTAIGSEDRFTKAKLIQDLERISRAHSTQADVDLEAKRARSQQAAELYEGFSSSDSEGDDEAQPTRHFAAGEHDQKTAGSNGVASSIRSPTGVELFDACTNRERRRTKTPMQGDAVANVKAEQVPTPSVFLERSADFPSPLIATGPSAPLPHASFPPGIETDREDVATPVPAHDKRPASQSSSTPLPRAKRPHVSDASSTSGE